MDCMDDTIMFKLYLFIFLMWMLLRKNHSITLIKDSKKDFIQGEAILGTTSTGSCNRGKIFKATLNMA